MTRESSTPLAPVDKVGTIAWRGLGLWNFYFVVKLLLYWAGYIDFDVYYNLLFVAALLIPLPPLWLHRLRSIVAIPFGVALFYYDTWLPPFSRLLAQPEVLQFSNDYLLELLGRFINWDLVGAGFIALVVYLLLSQWLRMTFFTMLAITVLSLMHWSDIWLPQGARLFVQNTWAGLTTQALNLPPADTLPQTTVAAHQDSVPVPATSPQPAATKPVSLNSLLDEELALFYEEEQDRRTEFSMPDGGEADFDLLFLNICSLSWDDLRVTDQLQHPLMGQMDIMFEAFNSVTSYSGPAVSRLMQANCGQRSHQDIYGSMASECSLFSSLHDLGYDTHVAMNHDGQFQGFIDYLASEPAFSSPFITEDARPVLRGFDNSPIWSDYETLSLWLDDKQQAPADQPRALLYNSITLHDGNREATADGGGRSSPYERRIQSLLDDLARFIDDLERRGRPTMVVLIPEHGAALEGDRMQISGLREIPAEKITRVPVGVRFIGVKSRPEEPIHVSGPTSFLALSELVARSIQIDVFDHAELDWSRLTDDLPKTRLVTENEAAVMLWHEQTPYVQLDGKNWIPYQQ